MIQKNFDIYMYGNLLAYLYTVWKLLKFSLASHFIGKNFVKATVLQKKLQKS